MSDRPQCVLVCPEIVLDVLSTVLQQVHVVASVFSRARVGPPWGLSTTGTTHAMFHAIVTGEGVVTVPGRPPAPWRAGDLVVLPNGAGHTMSDGTGRTSVPILSAERHVDADGLSCVTLGPRPSVEFLCGTFRLDPDVGSFLAPALPPVLVLRGHSDTNTTAWLEATLALVAARPMPGQEALVARMAEVLFVQVLRGAVAQGVESAWLDAVRDRSLSRALAAVHAEPARDWTSTTLARVAGMSRSAFYVRFQEVLGESPSAYLTRWRMTLARRALRGEASLAEVASRVGYSSDAAFSRAFKRQFGETPSDWRLRASTTPG